VCIAFFLNEIERKSLISTEHFFSVGSAVFDAMFNSTWPTSSEEIPLPDVEPASFLALLKFLYSDEVQIW
jgi:BTB/POZ domain